MARLDEEGGDEAGPERTCVVTRASGPPEALIRFVRGPGNAVVPDIRRKLPGRGVWVAASAKIVAEAIRKGAFARGFKGPAIAPAGLVADLDQLLERDALQSLSIANKAGLVITGFSKVEAGIGSGEYSVLLHAVDAAADGRRKLRQSFARAGGHEGSQVILFDSSQLGLALGRPHVIHAALAAGPATDAFVARLRKLARVKPFFRDGRDLSLDIVPRRTEA